MATNEDQPIPRRVMMRRARGGGFGSGTSSQSESLRAPAEEHEPDDVDDIIDPHEVHARVLSNARTTPRHPPHQMEPAQGQTDGAPSPRDRLHAVAGAGSAAFSKEYRLSLLNRLLMRRVPLDQIANQLGVSISTIEKDRVELKSRLREVARELDINSIVGGQVEMYGELSAMALRIASSDTTPVAMKLAATRTVLASEADKTRFLNTAGVFDALRFRKSEDGSDVSDVQQLMQNTADMFARLMDEGDMPEQRVVPRRARQAARPAGGFAKLTMDDKDASSGDEEEVEL